jgi:sugar lactone lactonase YvrE
MKRLLPMLVVCVLLVSLVIAPAAIAKRGGSTTTVATFSPGSWGSFAEGLAADSHGNLYVSMTVWGYASEDLSVLEPNIGEVWKISPCGAKSRVATIDLTPYGMMTGVAVDGADRFYAATADFAGSYGEPLTIGQSVFRLDGDVLTKVVSLPGDTFPNGIAFHEGLLYITDSFAGAVWRVSLGDGVAEPDAPWLQDELLAPDPNGYYLGANGLAFSGRQLYVSVYDYGRIVRVPVRSDGAPGAVKVVRETPELITADGIAFDIAGRLWIAVNAGSTGATPSGALYRLAQDGVLTCVFDDPGWLNYPTMPVFSTGGVAPGVLYIENGAYYNWMDGTSPDITAMRVGIPGLPLW